MTQFYHHPTAGPLPLVPHPDRAGRLIAYLDGRGVYECPVEDPSVGVTVKHEDENELAAAVAISNPWTDLWMIKDMTEKLFKALQDHDLGTLSLILAALEQDEGALRAVPGIGPGTDARIKDYLAEDVI